MRSALTLAALVVLAVCARTAGEPTSLKADFWVSPRGSDVDPGTAEKPFATLQQAQRAVRGRIAAGLTSDLVVVIRGGTYELGETLQFEPKDGGTDKYSVTYRACPGEKVVLSGGRRISGWRPGAGGVWTAQAPGSKQQGWNSRNLYVNGRRAERARTPNEGDKAACWQLAGAELTKDLRRFTLSLAPGLIQNWQHAEQIEVMVAGNWEVNRKRLESVDAKTGTVVLVPPHITGPAYIFPSRGRWCYFAGAKEFLDQPGEWHLDPSTGALSYRPLPEEKLEQV